MARFLLSVERKGKRGSKVVKWNAKVIDSGDGLDTMDTIIARTKKEAIAKGLKSCAKFEKEAV